MRQVLHRNELLKIEDILPFFPDFVKIDHFKEAIEESLKEYNTDIETLKREMDHATQSAFAIRHDIQQLRHFPHTSIGLPFAKVPAEMRGVQWRLNPTPLRLVIVLLRSTKGPRLTGA